MAGVKMKLGQIDKDHPITLVVIGRPHGLTAVSPKKPGNISLANLFFNVWKDRLKGKAVARLNLIVRDEEIVPELADLFFFYPGMNQVAVVRSIEPRVISKTRDRSKDRNLYIEIRKTLPKGYEMI